MGDPTVVVNKVLIKGRECYEETAIDPRAGWLVGYRNLMVEWTIGGDYEEGRYSAPVRRQDVYQVLFCPIHRPVMVPKDGLKLNEQGLKASVWSPEVRLMMSAEMKKWFADPKFAFDRDVRGRFT